MALLTVTGLTAAKMQEIAGETIIDAAVVGDNLILTTRAGADINAGNVRGIQGLVGPPVVSLNDVGDISADSPSNKQVLTFDVPSSNWIAANPISKLGELDNVTVAANPPGGSMLVFNEAINQWEAYQRPPITLHSVSKNDGIASALTTNPSNPTYISDTYMIVAAKPYDAIWDLSFFATFVGLGAFHGLRPTYRIGATGDWTTPWTRTWVWTSGHNTGATSTISGNRPRLIPANTVVDFRLYGYSSNTGVVVQAVSRTYMDLKITPVV